MKIPNFKLPSGSRAASRERGSLGVEDGEVPIAAAAHSSLQPFAVLDLPLEDQLWCDVCECEEKFTRVFVVPGLGMLGCCIGCGNERVIRYTRTVSEP